MRVYDNDPIVIEPQVMPSILDIPFKAWKISVKASLTCLAKTRKWGIGVIPFIPGSKNLIYNRSSICIIDLYNAALVKFNCLAAHSILKVCYKAMNAESLL